MLLIRFEVFLTAKTKRMTKVLFIYSLTNEKRCTSQSFFFLQNKMCLLLRLSKFFCDVSNGFCFITILTDVRKGYLFRNAENFSREACS